METIDLSDLTGVSGGTAGIPGIPTIGNPRLTQESDGGGDTCYTSLFGNRNQSFGTIRTPGRCNEQKPKQPPKR
ncbi:MAG TPA: hypothetical protein VIV11_18780 [Kofleriaceae bacterium]